jgi:hypothetical protein
MRAPERETVLLHYATLKSKETADLPLEEVLILLKPAPSEHRVGRK